MAPVPEICGKCPMTRRFHECEMKGGPDACPLLDEGPRIIGYDEAMTAEVAWLELRKLNKVMMVVPTRIAGEMYLETMTGICRVRDIAPRRENGKKHRFWDGRPTGEQRRATMWS